jgi:hypothetical protein
MTKLEHWFLKNNLITNIGKTVAMSFHARQNEFPVKPEDTFRNMDIVHK